jgi:hypothetical protein
VLNIIFLSNSEEKKLFGIQLTVCTSFQKEKSGIQYGKLSQEFGIAATIL